MANFICKKLSYLLLNLGFSVHNLLGPGLLESGMETICQPVALGAYAPFFVDNPF